MRRSTGVAAVAAALTLLTVTVLALPVVAAAADAQASYAGTYTGVASGRNAAGKKGSSGVTVWVQVSGDKTTFTFRVDKLPVVVSETGRTQPGAGAGTVVPLAINKAGIRGSGTLSFRISKQRWLLYGTGSGKALKWKGTGKLVCWRVSTGVALPSTVTQITDLFSALAGGRPKTSVEVSDTVAGTSGGAGSSASPQPSPRPSAQPSSATVPAAAATAGPNATAAPSSIVDLAGQEPPVPDTKQLTALGTVILILTMSLALGLATPQQAGIGINDPDHEALHRSDAPTDQPPEGS